MARTWWTWKSECFFLPNISVLVQKADFCHMTKILVNDPFLALGITVNFPPWDWFLGYPIRSYSRFCKKKRPVKKSSPSPLWGHRLPVTALALSAGRPFGPARFARGLDNGTRPDLLGKVHIWRSSSILVFEGTNKSAMCPWSLKYVLYNITL